jgi:acyl carrier protein
MTSEITVERVQAILLRVAGAGQGPGDVGPDTAIVDGGFAFDSVHLLEAIMACEAEFGVVFDARTDFTDDHLKTVATLHALIRHKRRG